MGLDPTIWGPKTWFFLHSVALIYPENPTKQDKKNYKTFFESLQHVLPCPGCSDNYKRHLKELPIDLSNNINLNKWLIEMHNKVNDIYNKPRYTYEQFIDLYTKLYTPSYSYYYLIFVFIVIILTLLFIYYYFKIYK